jgi:electron-transferring-flavoprotein dehydrogenase
MKHHPYLRKLLSPSSSSDTFTPSRIAYGARVLVEGGLQSIPLLHFPGGAIIGDSAGFVNIAKIKGVHNSMKTGMLGGEGAFKALESESEGAFLSVISSTTSSDINLHASFHSILGILRPP